jgi:glycosyltransferase involved in cell wall biosynthesis
MKGLDIVLRTCDRGPVHPERGPRFIDTDKQTLIKKCLISLLNSIDQAKQLANIKVFVVDDNSVDDTLNYIKNKLVDYKIEHEIIICEKEGFNYSAMKQFEVCKEKGRKWVYCVEDDYLHFPEAIKQMLIMSERFENITGNHIAIRPDDDLFTYSPNSPHSRKPSVILLGDDRHWRTLHNTHNTIFTHADVFKDYWELFASLGKFFKVLSINEDKSINMIWEKVPLFSPIPTLAIHISQNNEPPFVDYKTLWNNTPI